MEKNGCFLPSFLLLASPLASLRERRLGRNKRVLGYPGVHQCHNFSFLSSEFIKSTGFVSVEENVLENETRETVSTSYDFKDGESIGFAHEKALDLVPRTKLANNGTYDFRIRIESFRTR